MSRNIPFGRTDRQTAGHDETNGLFFQVCDGVYMYSSHKKPNAKKLAVRTLSIVDRRSCMQCSRLVFTKNGGTLWDKHTCFAGRRR